MSNANKLTLPDFTIIKASAGTGKTHSLTRRYLSILLDDDISNSILSNILAVTFSNAAAKEMKERILEWLKGVYFLDADLLCELEDVLPSKEEEIQRKASDTLDNIFSNYTDFQIRTIDSFTSTLLRSSAVDLGFSPDFEILMQGDELFLYAFDLLLKQLDSDAELKELIFDAIRVISELRKDNSSFMWDPSEEILGQMKMLHREISIKGKDAVYIDLKNEVKKISKEIRERVLFIDAFIASSGLDNYRHLGSGFKGLCEDIKKGNVTGILSRSLNTAPLKKLDKAGEHLQEYRLKVNEGFWQELKSLAGDFCKSYARSYFVPYIKIFKDFESLFKDIKNAHDKVLIEDINKSLLGYIKEEIIPDIYIRLGEKIYHYLIDEFQDTSYSQWNNLMPLIENSLSQAGSLFMVGDTKQAIFGFRDADFKIMSDYAGEKLFFASVKQKIEMLKTSYRSFEAIVDFNNRIFKEKVARDEEYGSLAFQSGLTDFFQDVKNEYENKGFVEVKICQDPEEKEVVYDALDRLCKAGYSYSDIAILTSKNDDVVKVSAWLNEKDEPVNFVSFSSLDVRKSFIAQELLALLSFLNSPPDNLSFATFLLGTIFEKSVVANEDITKAEIDDFLFKNKDNKPGYVYFKKAYPDIWEKYFLGLFKSVGYMPLYDIACQTCRVFDLFNKLPEEEACIVKMLEVIKNFEDNGSNNLHDFLDFAYDEDKGESEWNIALPEASDAVKIMTIHKSKGLGFPAVIVLLYEERAKGFEYIPYDTPLGIEFLKINKSMSFNEGSEYENLYEKHSQEEKISSLNKLYVSLTRAKEAMFVIGVCSNMEKPKFPVKFFDEFRSGELVFTQREAVSQEEAIKAFHRIKKPEAYEKTASVEGEEEKRRGDVIHAVLEGITFAGDDLLKEIEDAAKKVITLFREELDYKRISDVVYAFLNTDDVLPFFLPSYCEKVLNEASFADEKGNIKRMDRVVFLKSGQIVILDYKTGADALEASYIKQVENYIAILKGIYPAKSITGCICYVDLKRMVKVG